MQNSVSPIRVLAPALLILIQLCLLPASRLSAREFTDAKGRKIEAEITGATPDGKVEILRGGKTITAPITLFSLDDQDYIRKWIKEHPDAVSYRFNYYVDLDELREQNSAREGSMVTDKLKTKPQRLLVNVTNKNPIPIKDLKVVVDAVVDDAVNIVDGSYARLAVGAKRSELVRTQRFRAEGTFPEINPKGRAELTFEFNIERYVDRDGGKVDGTATDRVLGAWIRVYKGGKMVGEFKRAFESKFDEIKWSDEGLSKASKVKTTTK